MPSGNRHRLLAHRFAQGCWRQNLHVGAQAQQQGYPAHHATPGAAWKTHGTALITGGLGALGMQVARFLIRSGAQSLVLASALGHGKKFVPSLVEAQEQLTGAQLVPR